MKNKNLDNGNTENKDTGLLFGIPKKTVIVAVVVIMILLVAAAFITSLLTKFGKEEIATKYPASTLLHEASSEHRFISSEVLARTMGCPSLPYEIDLPDNITASSDEYVAAEYDGVKITLLESNVDFETAIYGTLGEVCENSFEIPDIEWSDQISDIGYFNGYSAEYHAGKYHLVGRMSAADYYAVIYRISFDGMDKAIYVQAVTDSLETLQSGKDVVDSMLYTLQSTQGETVETEETETTESTKEEGANATESVSESGDNIEFMESTEASPTDLYTKDFEVYVSEDMPELFIVFSWTNIMVQPSVLYVTAPDGSVYEVDEDYSSDGQEVFYITDAESGTYIIHGEVAGTIYGCTYEALSKEAFYQIYLNQDVNGETATYFDEDYEDEDYEDYEE